LLARLRRNGRSGDRQLEHTRLDDDVGLTVSALRRGTARRVPAAQLAIWGLSASMILAAGVLWAFGAGSAKPLISSISLPFWALLLGFAAAERFVIHVHFRRSAHSMSMGEIPLVFGLMFATGPQVVLAHALGRLAILALQRKLPPIRLAFNLGQFLLGGCVAVLVFHAAAGSAAVIDPAVWGAAALATAANSVMAVLLISAAVSLSDVRLSVRQIAASLRTDLTMVLVTTSLGLSAVTLVYRDWRTVILMAVPVFGMFGMFHAYTAERQRHVRIEFLYESARTLSSSAEIGPAMKDLLARALEAFRAEAAEVVFLSPDGGGALRTTVREGAAASVLEPVEPAIAAELRALAERQEIGAAPTHELAGGRLADYLAPRALDKGMFAVLKGDHSWIGTMMIGNPSGRVDRFATEDVRLLETLANNTGIALENDRLGQTIWRMQELQRELEHQASHDPLTDLANRLLFVKRVGGALERDPENVSVIFVDINDFKKVNDSLGHAAGDELLVAIAGRLGDCVRPADTLARMGGDEFAILLEQAASREEAIEVAQRINRRLAERFSVARQSVSVRASTGIATGATAGVTAEEMIGNADVAMYQAKQSGARPYRLFESGMQVPTQASGRD
jgi:diguanylate cyclase (GGDEF)-like protein